MYHKKVVLCGNVVEVYEYKEPILNGYQNKILKEKREQTDEVKKENYARSIKHTKRTIRELVNCNFDNDNSSFLTLTFKDNVTDYDVAFSSWKRFKQKVERKYKLKLSYLGVVEFQKRGAIHFHICLFNVPYLKHSELYEMWLSVTRGGGVYIEKVNTDTCDNVGAYVTKYITKDSDDFFDNEYKGKKRYFRSRNLKEPVAFEYDVTDKNQLKEFNDFMSQMKDNIVFEYDSKPFEIKRKEDVKKVVCFEQLEKEKIDMFDNFYVPGDIRPVILEQKETVETLVGVQQLSYTQILIKLNKENRDKNNKYIYDDNKNNDNNKVVNIKKII